MRSHDNDGAVGILWRRCIHKNDPIGLGDIGGKLRRQLMAGTGFHLRQMPGLDCFGHIVADPIIPSQGVAIANDQGFQEQSPCEESMKYGNR